MHAEPQHTQSSHAQSSQAQQPTNVPSAPPAPLASSPQSPAPATPPQPTPLATPPQPAPPAASGASPSHAPGRGLGTTAIVLGVASVAIPVINALLVAISIAAVEPGLQMVTALLTVPVGGVLAGLLGIAAIVFAIVCRAKSKGSDRRWITGLVLGIIGTLATPVALVILFGIVDAGGFT